VETISSATGAGCLWGTGTAGKRDIHLIELERIFLARLIRRRRPVAVEDITNEGKPLALG